MSYPPDESQDINKKDSITRDEELNPCKIRLNSSVQGSPLCTSSISSHRTELVLNLPSKSVNNIHHQSQVKGEQSSPQRQLQPVGQVSHRSDLSSVNQPLSTQQSTLGTIRDDCRQIENLYESLNYSPFKQQPVAYESHQTKTSHAALRLQPVIPDNIYQPISTQLTYHSHQNSHPFRPRGSIRFSSTFPVRNQSNNHSLGTIIHNSAGSLTIPTSSQVTYCIPFNSTPGARFSVSFTGNPNRLPGSSAGSSSFTIFQSQPTSQTSQEQNLPSTSHTELFLDSHKSILTSSHPGQSFTQQHPRQQVSFVGGKVTSVVIPFQTLDSSTMNRQISAPSSGRHPSESNLRLPERSASVSPNASPTPPPRPAVPKPSARRPTTSASSASIPNDGYLTGLLSEQKQSLDRLVQAVARKKLQVNALRTDVQSLELNISQQMKCRNGEIVNALQAQVSEFTLKSDFVTNFSPILQEIRKLWEKKRDLSIGCQYWALAVDSFGDHYLGDVNGDRPPPKMSPSSNPPKIPERPKRSPGVQAKQPPFSELDVRVPIQKIRPTSNLVRSAEVPRWSCTMCNHSNPPSKSFCELCSSPRSSRHWDRLINAIIGLSTLQI